MHDKNALEQDLGRPETGSSTLLIFDSGLNNRVTLWGLLLWVIRGIY